MKIFTINLYDENEILTFLCVRSNIKFFVKLNSHFKYIFEKESLKSEE